MTTIRNKRWQMRNGNQVLRDRYQKELAIVYPDNTMTFLGEMNWYSTWEAARDAAERMATDAGYRLAERVKDDAGTRV